MMGKSTRSRGWGNSRSAILLRITILISVVMLLAGAGTFLLLRNSQRNMADGCIENLVQTEAGNFSESYNYIGNLLSPIYAVKFKDIPESDLFYSLQHQEISELQHELNSDLAQMVDSGFMGLEEVMVVLPRHLQPRGESLDVHPSFVLHSRQAHAGGDGPGPRLLRPGA